ncbi:MAG: amidohydrolase [Oscillospiraceae bacterium]|nr:amidohydrolase [Oscillospiraceae bacterium]
METLFSGITVVPVDERDTVLRDAYVGIAGGKITYIGDRPPEAKAARVISGANKVMIPGLCNAHTHIPMTLLRGYADDYDLHTWLHDHIFPAEERLTEDMIYEGARLAVLEMLAGGTVAFTEMYGQMMQVGRAAAESGMKANIAQALIHIGSGAYDAKTDARFAQTRELADAYHDYDNGRIRVDVSIHAEYTSGPAVWEEAARYAIDRGLGMNLHLSETREEHEACKTRRNGRTPAQVFHAARLFNVRTTAAHCVWLENDDIEILGEMGVTAAHCPVSNAKLVSGTANVPLMQQRGVNVALGTDGAASNNSLDMFEEMKAAAILNKLARRDPEAVKAADALRMATANGYLAQGRAGEGGRIQVGCEADLAVLDFDKPHLTPCHNVISHLVYAARASDVCLTMVRGKILYENGEFPALDAEKIKAGARKAAETIAGSRHY